jgi:hypothetical protein
MTGKSPAVALRRCVQAHNERSGSIERTCDEDHRYLCAFLENFAAFLA